MTIPANILIVDDEASIRFFIEEMLSRDGHHVTSVGSGKQALDQIKRDDVEFDLALIDLKMEEIGGMEVLKAIREQSPNTAVIVLTAHASLETAVEALRHGAHDYLFKPCKTVQLRESVRAGLLKRQRELRRQSLLNQLEQNLATSLKEIRATATDAPVTPLDPLLTLKSVEPEESAIEEERFLQRGKLIVDFMRHVITFDGHLLELSPTEFDLMAYLISEAPRVISPQDLVREVQGYHAEPWEASDMVRYHIYRIRQKIEKFTDEDDDDDVIRTVRGVGYAID
jgi:DNA-binding response OmpR family regulator